MTTQMCLAASLRVAYRTSMGEGMVEPYRVIVGACVSLLSFLRV